MHHTRWLIGVLVLTLLAPGLAEAEEGPAAAAYEGRDVAAWAGDLAAEDLAVRRKAVYALWHLRTPARDHAPALAKALRDEDDYIRTTAERILATYEWQTSIRTLTKALPELIEALADKRATVRLAAVSIIWLAGPQPNVVGDEPPPAALMPALLEALGDVDSRVRANAAASLANIQKDAAPALPALRKALGDEDPKVRMWSVRGLSWIGGAATVRTLLDHTNDDDPGVRASVYGAIAGATGDDVDGALAALIRGIDDKDATARTAAINGLWTLGDVRALPALVKVLDEAEDPLLRGAVAGVIGGLGDPRATAPLLALLRESAGTARFSAASALARLGPEGAVAVPEILKLFRKGTVEQKTGLALSIGQFGALAPQAVPVLIEAMAHENKGLRAMAASSLSGFAMQGLVDDALIAAAIRGLDDSDLQVRQYSNSILSHAGAKAAPALPGLLKRLALADESLSATQLYYTIGNIGPAAAAALPALRARTDEVPYTRLANAWAIVCVAADPKEVDAAVQALIDGMADDTTRVHALYRLKLAGPRAKRAALTLRFWMKGDTAWAVGAAAALLRIEGAAAKDAVAFLEAELAGTKANGAMRQLADVGPAGLALTEALLKHAEDVASPERSQALAHLLKWGAKGERVRAAFALARKDPTAWIRTLGARGLAQTEPK